LEAKEQSWKAVLSKLEEESAKAKSKITLDVGGTKFATSKSTLTKFKDSYFYAMLSSGRFKPDDDGAYFIDRDPKHFGTILNFMRTGKINLQSWGKEDLELLQEDLDYYQIQLPIPTVLPNEWDKTRASAKIQIQEGVITRIGEDGWDSAILGTVRNPKSFKLKILNIAYNFTVGLAPHDVNVNKQIHAQYGWLFHNNSCLYTPQRNTTTPSFTYPQFQNGDVVLIEYDQIQKQISISINENSYGVAFQNIDTDGKDVCACAIMGKNGSYVELCKH